MNHSTFHTAGLVLWLLAQSSEGASPPGLTLDGSGRILKDGIHFRGVGVNYFDFWVFDYSAQEREFNITPGNSRAWQLSVLRDWNLRLQSAGSSNRP